MADLNLILFHSGKQLPSYLDCTFTQIRLWNPYVKIYFLTDRNHKSDIIFQKYQIIVLNKDLFYTEKIKEFINLFGRKANDFWTITAIRLMYIEECMRALGLTNVYHIENDVLLYYNLKEHHQQFQYYPHMAITIGGEDKAMTGFFFIRSWDCLAHMTQFFINSLNTFGLKGFKDKYKTDMVNEMTLMKAYNKEFPTRLESLPTIPFEEETFKRFNSIFDPASWGQFVGGTTDGIPGAKPEDHYIGQLLRNHPKYKVVWKKEDNKKVPYFHWGWGKETKINNLHIHSKNLHKYVSYD